MSSVSLMLVNIFIFITCRAPFFYFYCSSMQFFHSAPSGAPQNFSARGLTETSVHLSWDFPARNLRNGEILMYQITYHKLADTINEEGLNITDLFVDIVGLEMNTDYIFLVKAYTSVGAGPWSNRLHFRTFGSSEGISCSII